MYCTVCRTEEETKAKVPRIPILPYCMKGLGRLFDQVYLRMCVYIYNTQHLT